MGNKNLLETLNTVIVLDAPHIPMVNWYKPPNTLNAARNKELIMSLTVFFLAGDSNAALAVQSLVHFF